MSESQAEVEAILLEMAELGQQLTSAFHRQDWPEAVNLDERVRLLNNQIQALGDLSQIQRHLIFGNLRALTNCYQQLIEEAAQQMDFLAARTSQLEALGQGLSKQPSI